MSRVASPTLEFTRASQSDIAMYVLLVSWSILFGTLFFGYMMFRASTPQWPPMGMERIPLLYPSLSTFAIILSSLSFYRFQQTLKLAQDGADKKPYPFLLTTLVLGSIFLGLQCLLWQQMHQRGLFASTGIFPSLIYAFTWIHSAHIFMAVVALVYLVIKYQREALALNSITAVNIGKFWHFLGIIWIIMYLILFLL